MTLVEFLLARIAEDEAVACNVDPCHFEYEALTGDAWDDVADLLRVFNPARVLAECAAKRRIVELHPLTGGPEEWMDEDEWDDWQPYCEWCTYDNRHVPFPCPTLRALAVAYADHPDFREEWRV